MGSDPRLILVLCGLKWPSYLDPSFQLIIGAISSIAVFAAGITLSSVRININGQAVMGSVLKLIVMPLLILIAGIIFRMDPLNLKMLVVCAALPPAFSGIIIASQKNCYVATGTSSPPLDHFSSWASVRSGYGSPTRACAGSIWSRPLTSNF